MLTVATGARLQALHGYATAYEITATNGADVRLVAYTRQKSRHGILRALQRRGQMIIDQHNITEETPSTWGPRAADGLTLGQWSIKFSGRTEREALIAGEYPLFVS